jgi:hypothetical protein
MTEGGLLSLPTDYMTLVLLVIALMIFVWLVVKSRSIRSFQFQVSIFIAIMVAGGIVDLLSNNGIIQLPPGFQELGFLIHVGSMIFFSLMIWLRYYISKRNGRKMIEEIEE